MLKLVGVGLGYGLGILGATIVGTQVLAVQGPLKPLEAAIIGAVVGCSKDATGAIIDYVPIYLDRWQLHRLLRVFRKRLGSDAHKSDLMPFRQIESLAGRVLSHRPRNANMLENLLAYIVVCKAKLLNDNRREIAFGELHPDRVEKFKEILG